jgi:hypothetical protein
LILFIERGVSGNMPPSLTRCLLIIVPIIFCLADPAQASESLLLFQQGDTVPVTVSDQTEAPDQKKGSPNAPLVHLTFDDMTWVPEKLKDKIFSCSLYGKSYLMGDRKLIFAVKPDLLLCRSAEGRIVFAVPVSGRINAKNGDAFFVGNKGKLPGVEEDLEGVKGVLTLDADISVRQSGGH